LVKATTDGVVCAPSWLTMTAGPPPSIAATTELVVPRLIPIVFDGINWSLEDRPLVKGAIRAAATGAQSVVTLQTSAGRLPLKHSGVTLFDYRLLLLLMAVQWRTLHYTRHRRFARKELIEGADRRYV
jgi:hypothetical protein